MFLPAAIALTMLIIGLAVSQGPRVALWAGWTLALLVPTWATRPILSLALDMRTITGIAAVGLLLLMIPLAGAIGRWLWCDTFVLLMVFFQWVSMIVTDSFAPSVALLPITLVLLPYMAGRLAVAKMGDVHGLLRWLAYVIVIMSVLSVIESVVHLNLFNTFFGRPTDSAARFEFMRAMGPMSHPIYFGMTLALLLPWAVWGAVLSRRGLGPRWWFALPFCCVFGIFSSLSRGPTIATIGTFLCVLFFVLPKMRLWLAGGVLAFGILVAVAGDVLLEGLRFTESTGDRGRAPMRMLVDGEWVEYDGTLHRILLFKVYDEALIAGGWLGHGLPVLGKTDDLTVVGSNVSSIMGSIDNHYIYYTMRFGFLGIGLFLCAAACGMYYTGREAWGASLPTQLFSAAHFGSLTMVSLLLLTVWFSPDFAWVWLFSLGYATAWRAHGVGLASAFHPQPTMGQVTRNVAVRRLVPGHPVAGKPDPQAGA